ncbi:hypothetical protein PR202_gb07090 [Eleusine coracana subsp. coracana]|uniref:Uncharacterized protein n=1 Tax=Eleusine coracana subsp. coracana TaxID=191504 RepID=A0AAV5EB54_ELECO|nr:hypothetical protein PR202_gb07090 [Eleusine coracana subsp. coracana]
MTTSLKERLNTVRPSLPPESQEAGLEFAHLLSLERPAGREGRACGEKEWRESGAFGKEKEVAVAATGTVVAGLRVRSGEGAGGGGEALGGEEASAI